MKKKLFVLVLSVFMLAMLFAAKPETSSNGQVSMGSWNGRVYTNDFLGLKFKLPDGWTRYGDEEMAEIMHLGTELLDDNQKYLAELAKLNIVYYILVNNPATGDNVVIMTEKSALDYTIDYYLDAVKAQLLNLESIDYEVSDSFKEKIAGKEYSAVVANVSGVNMTQKYYARKLDKHFLAIIVTSRNGEDAINKIMKNFE